MNPTSSPPAETGKRLATLERGPDEQLRINWCVYEGSPYLSLRIWFRDFQGRWWPSREKGLTIRIKELDQVGAAIAEATALAEAHSATLGSRPAPYRPPAVRSMPARQSRRRGPYNRPSPPEPSSPAEPFSEF